MTIHESAYVAADAHICGDVTIGALSSIWPCAVLRGDSSPISVGERSNIQDGCVAHCTFGIPIEVGDGVTVGHNAILHSCVLEDDCLVGMGSIIMDGARVGAGSMVAAGSLVPHGMQIPPGVLVVGSPAKVRRELSPGERRELLENAEEYVELGQSAKRAEQKAAAPR